MEKQISAVDFMVEQLNKSIGLTKFVDTCDEEYKQEILGIIEQANKMFEEQIIDAWFDGVTNWDSEKEVEDYINETFKSE